jgi:hypothetical protein
MMDEPRFIALDTIATTQLTLVYDVFSRAIEPLQQLPHMGITLQVKFVQLCLSEDGDVIFPDGYLPITQVPLTGDVPPSAPAGSLRVLDVDAIWEKGITQGIGAIDDWGVSITEDRAWIAMRRVFPPETPLQSVRFAPPCIAVLAGERLVELWLQIDNLPSV